MPAGVRRWPWRLSLTLSLGRPRAGRERLSVVSLRGVIGAAGGYQVLSGLSVIAYPMLDVVSANRLVSNAVPEAGRTTVSVQSLGVLYICLARSVDDLWRPLASAAVVTDSVIIGAT